MAVTIQNPWVLVGFIDRFYNFLHKVIKISGVRASMAGFFGLFKSKSKYIDEVTEKDREPPNQKGEAYFLETDEAKSLGKKMKDKEVTPTKSNSTESKPAIQANPSQTKRPSTDSNLDMFRKMAREIKKK